MSYGDMVNRIANEIIRSDLGTEIRQAIQSAILRYRGERFWFNEQRATASTVNNQEFYSLPTDFVEMDSMTATVSGHTYPLNVRTSIEIDEIDSTSSTRGRPDDVAIYQEQFRIYPIPDAAYTLTLNYQRVLPALSGDADTNAWMTVGESLIRSRAKKELFAHVLKDDQEAARMARLEAEALFDLLAQTERRITVGRLRPTRF